MWVGVWLDLRFESCRKMGMEREIGSDLMFEKKKANKDKGAWEIGKRCHY